MGKSAIILGSSGLTGSLLLNKLLSDERYDKIILFLRSSSDSQNPKVTEFVVDLLKLEEQEAHFKADEVYCCIGTTKKKTPNQDDYHKIDYGIPVAAAQLCKANNITKLLVVSAMGASVESSIFYNRTKGEMERAILELEIAHTSILRPALITGNRSERRFGEKLSFAVFAFLNVFLFGSLKKYRSIKAERIAEAMVKIANNPIESKIIDSGMVQQIADA